MQTVTIGELQKTIGNLSSVVQPIRVVNQKKKEEVGVFYPTRRQESSIMDLAGSCSQYKKPQKDLTWKQEREIALTKAFSEKYDNKNS